MEPGIMTAQASLHQAAAIYDRLQHVNAALAALAGAFTVAGIFLRDGNGNQVVAECPLPTVGVTNALTNQQTALQNALTALGVT
jgi:hypothetical protein